ncbi:MAG: helix-turn-helix domain-containing protein [Saprospiraceae bacterium]
MDITADQKAKLRELRKNKGWTLNDLSNRCGVAVSTLSSIESGALKSIRDETYQKIADALDYDLQAGNKPMHIGIGHSIWSSPVILAFRTPNGIRGWKMYSCGSAVDGFAPYLIESEKSIDPDLLPSFGLFNDSDSNDARPEKKRSAGKPSEKQVRHQPFTGIELVNHLENEQNQMVIVPRILLEQRNRTELIPVSSLVYSSVGGTLLSIFSNKNHDKFKDLSDTASLEELLDVCSTEDGKKVFIKILYPRGTNCERHYERLLRPSFKEYKNSHPSIIFKEIPEPLEVTDIEDSAKSIIQTLIEEPDLTVWLLGWQPISSWIERNVRNIKPGYGGADGIFAKHLDLIKMMNLRENESVVNFEFSIYIKKNDPMLQSTEMLDILLETLYAKTKELNQEINYIRFFYKSNKVEVKYDDVTSTNIVPTIAEYLDMEQDSCARALSGINFHFSIDPEFYFFIRHKTDKS